MSPPNEQPRIAAQSSRVSVAPEVELAYIERGSGQPVIFIPHWTFTKEVFEHQIDILSEQFRVVAYDPRSQGESSFSLEGNDYITHAHDLAALLAALHIEHPILVGWGAGALTAWGFGKLKGPSALTSLVVIDISPKSLSTDPGAWSEGTVDELGAIHTLFLRDAKGHENFMRRYLETVMVQRTLEPEELDWLLRQSLSTNPLVAAQLYASRMFSDLTNAAIAVARNRPTLFFVAQNQSETAVPFLRRQMPEARYVVFGGRMMFWEHFDAFNHVLKEFIQTHVAMQGNLARG